MWGEGGLKNDLTGVNFSLTDLFMFYCKLYVLCASVGPAGRYIS